MLIECIATTLGDAQVIERAGADRIELVSSLTEGGLTPSYGLVETVVNQVSIPIHVMIRPHAQSFCYTSDEIQIMKKDIQMFRSLGVNGVVLGVLNEKQELNESALADLLSVCNDLDVTFHRAIDDTENPIQLMEQLKKYPLVTTVLTSGGKGEWPIRLQTILKMSQVAGRISILVGSGLDETNIISIDSILQTGQYHFGTALRKERSPLQPIDDMKVKKMVQLLCDVQKDR